MKDIRIDGIIGDWNNTTEEIQYRIEALELEKGDDLKVIISSPGGSVFEGFAIYNYLVSSEYTIHTEVQGLAASIATLIAMAADKRNSSISEVAMFMIHKASIGLEGNADELEKQVEILNKIDETLISVYSSRSGMKRSEIEKLLGEETWYNAKDAVKEGFIGNVVNRIDAKMVALATKNLKQNNMKIIDDLLKKYRGEDTLTPEELEAKAEKERFDALTTEEQEAELLEIEKERFDGLSPEDQQAELDEQNKSEYVTKEDFEKLSDLVTEYLETKNKEKSIEDMVKEAVANIPRSNTLPTKPQSQVKTPVNGYVDKYQKQREEMAEIEKRTRLT